VIDPPYVQKEREMGARTENFQDLVAWQRGMDLVQMVYEVSRDWPTDERFGLVAQIRRALVSVPSNLAEGYARNGPREYFHHASIAFGSLAEVQTQIIISVRLGYTTPESEAALIDALVAVRRPLSGLLRVLKEGR
jgi:four helix bundle protein